MLKILSDGDDKHRVEDAAGTVIGWIAVGWVLFICILFVLPPASPVTLQTFNYAPVAVIVVVSIAVVTWRAWGKTTFMQGAKDEHTTRGKGEVLDER